MKTILLTGFEPFGGDAINPSWEAVQQFSGRKYGEFIIVAEKLSCTFSTAHLELAQLCRQFNPAIVINIGQAAGRSQVSLEKVALNWIDARIADNAGNQPMDCSIITAGDAAYFSNLPLKSLVAKLKQVGIPSAISYSAGTYVCNFIFYHLMNLIQTTYHNTLGGFIHIPFLPEQVVNQPQQPSMSLLTIVTAIDAILAELVAPQSYTPSSAGTIC